MLLCAFCVSSISLRIRSFIMEGTHCCQEKITELQQQLKDITIKVTAEKEKYHQDLVENLKKDLKITDLEKKIELQIYHQFAPYFSTHTLKLLRQTNELVTFDSKFISIAIKDLYSDNLGILSKKTLSGRATKCDKEPISPMKKKILENLFAERIHKLEPKEHKERFSNLNKLIRNAIDNVNKREKR